MHMEDARATSEVVEVEARAMPQGLARQPTITTSDLEADVVAHVENRDPRGVEMSQALVAVTENPVAIEPVAKRRKRRTEVELSAEMRDPYRLCVAMYGSSARALLDRD